MITYVVTYAVISVERYEELRRGGETTLRHGRGSMGACVGLGGGSGDVCLDGLGGQKQRDWTDSCGASMISP